MLLCGSAWWKLVNAMAKSWPEHSISQPSFPSLAGLFHSVSHAPFCDLAWGLREGVGTDAPFRSKCSAVSHSQPLDQFWVPELCRPLHRMAFLIVLTAALIYTNKCRYLEGSLTTCLFARPLEQWLLIKVREPGLNSLLWSRPQIRCKRRYLRRNPCTTIIRASTSCPADQWRIVAHRVHPWVIALIMFFLMWLT